MSGRLAYGLLLCVSAYGAPLVLSTGEMHGSLGSFSDVWLEANPTNLIRVEESKSVLSVYGEGGYLRLNSATGVLMDGLILSADLYFPSNEVPRTADGRFTGVLSPAYAQSLGFEGPMLAFGSFNITDKSDYGEPFTWSLWMESYDPAAVPEPATAGLTAAACVVCLLSLRRNTCG